MSDPENLNPYEAPPTVEVPEVRLGEDSEFLISAREILCRESVELPRVCVQTGETEGLVQRKEKFQSFDLKVVGFAILLAVGVLLFAGSMGTSELILLFGLMIAARVLMSRRSTSRLLGIAIVSVTWYVSEEYLQKCQRQQWIVRGAIAVTTFLIGFAIAASNVLPGSNRLMPGLYGGILFGGVSGFVSLMLKSEKKIRYSGRRRFGPHKGLYSLVGHSRVFTETVERIAHGGF